MYNERHFQHHKRQKLVWIYIILALQPGFNWLEVCQLSHREHLLASLKDIIMKVSDIADQITFFLRGRGCCGGSWCSHGSATGWHGRQLLASWNNNTVSDGGHFVNDAKIVQMEVIRNKGSQHCHSAERWYECGSSWKITVFSTYNRLYKTNQRFQTLGRF